MWLHEVVSICTCLISIGLAGKVDLTLQVGARGAETVRSVLSKMEQVNLFNFPSVPTQRGQINEQFMREMAYVESEDGEEMDTDSMEGGIWRVDSRIFKETQSYNYSTLYHLICESFCIDWRTVNFRDLTKPLYSGLTVRIYMYHLDTIGRGLPEGARDKTKAEFWLKRFQENQQQFSMKWFIYVSQLRRIEVCRVNKDVVFVLDSSGSIGPTNYQLVRDYTYNFTQYLLSGDNDNRVGIILFGSSADIEVNLDYLMRNTEQDLLNRITRLPYLSQSTNTPEALCLLKTMNWSDSISTLRLAVVLTDGRSNEKSRHCGNGAGTVKTTSTEIHNRRPQIVVTAIGVANFVPSELELIATSNDTVDQLQSFDPNLLEQNQYYRSYSTCYKLVQDVRINQETEGTADEGSVSRLQFSGSHDEGVSIKICIEVGGVIIYGSYSNPNPGPALHDFMEELSDSVDSRCLTTHVDQNTTKEDKTCTTCGSDRRKRQVVVNEITVYITIEGSVNGSQFTVISDSGKTMIDDLKDGCRGDSNLCDSDATVVCNRNGSVIYLCECVYVAGMEDLPPCAMEDILSSTSSMTEDAQQSSALSNELFVLLIASAAAVCLCGLVMTAICIGCAIKRHRKNKQVQYMMLERSKCV